MLSRGKPFGKPLTDLEPAVVRELFPPTGAAGRYSEGDGGTPAMGYSNTVADRVARRWPVGAWSPSGAGVFHATFRR